MDRDDARVLAVMVCIFWLKCDWGVPESVRLRGGSQGHVAWLKAVEIRSLHLHFVFL